MTLASAPIDTVRLSVTENSNWNKPVYETNGLNLWYGTYTRTKKYRSIYKLKRSHSDHRTFWLWKVNLLKDIEPNGRDGTRRSNFWKPYIQRQ